MTNTIGSQNFKTRMLEWLCLLIAALAGPLFFTIGYAVHFVYGVAGAAYFIYCATAIPLLTYGAGRFKLVAWQLAVISLVVSAVRDASADGFQLHGRELFTWVYFSWFFAEVLSSPLPIYYRLKPLPKRRKFIEGTIFAVAALALFGGLALLGH